jgi:hypothetical protein
VRDAACCAGHEIGADRGRGQGGVEWLGGTEDTDDGEQCFEVVIGEDPHRVVVDRPRAAGPGWSA